MRRELERAPLVLIEGTNPHTLRAHVRREWQRGNLTPRSGVLEVRPGIWAVEVDQLRPARPAWVKPAAVTAGTVTVLGGAGLLGWWLLSAVAAFVAGVGLAGLAIGSALAWLAIAGLTGGTGHGCETIVTVRHRH